MTVARAAGTLRAQPVRSRAGTRIVGVALCLQMVLLFAAAANGQTTQPPRSFRGLFGRQDDNSKRRHWTDFTMSFSEGLDNNVNAQLGADTLPFRQSGLYSNLETGLLHTRVRRERRLTVTVGSAMRYDPAPYRLLSTNYVGAVAFTSPVSRGARLNVTQSVTYTPFYQLELFPTLPFEGGQMPKVASNDYAIGKQSAYTYTSGIKLVEKFNARSSLQLGYDLRSVTFAGAASDFLMQGAAIKFTHNVTRYAGFHAGFGSRIGQYSVSAGPNRISTHDIDIGLDYNPPISFWRRTTLTFSSGSSLVPEGGRTHYRVSGNASLAHQIGRSWLASLTYDRAVQFIDVFPAPSLADSIAARVKGNPSRRVDVTFSGGYSAGQIGLSAGSTAYGTYTGSAQLGMTLNRHFALHSEYVYYHYRVDQQPGAPAFPGPLDRQTARVGLKLWFPLFD
jgi:hypothetical protein